MFSWMALWILVLRAVGIRSFSADKDERREHMKRLGRPLYFLLYGVLGWGLAFGLALTVPDVIRGHYLGWVPEIAKLSFVSIAFGLSNAARSWSATFREPVQYPPKYD